MKYTKNRKRFFFIPFGVAALLAIVSYVVMLLWNNLLPEIINVKPITFWQAMGIFILCKILFGFGKGNGGGPWARHRMAEKCRDMSPEDRLQFKEKMRNKFCNWNKQEPDNS